MRFTLHCIKIECPEQVKLFYYDNNDGLLRDASGNLVGDPRPGLSDYKPAFKADQAHVPIRKHNAPRVLKIQLGLSCNFSCSYCLQKYVPRVDASSVRLVAGFIEKVKTYLCGQPQNIQLWGGEPLVYIKALRPLVSELKQLFPAAKFSMVTNGS
ncbi:MAG: 4Fe-4S cluster-binding domain-containing protein, partial [Bryobacteraceae bacterium]